MNEVIQSFIEDPSTAEKMPTAIPAANSTSAFQISAGYMHVIVAVYAIVVVLVIFIIIIIVAQSIRKSWRRKKDNSRYGAIPHQHNDGLDPDDNSRIYGPHQDDDDSEYDNISLNRDRGDPDDNGSDVPPLYENPPSYLDSGHHVDHGTCISSSYENPPSYLCINR